MALPLLGVPAGRFELVGSPLSLWKNEQKIRAPQSVKGGLETPDTLYDSAV
jgi:hypothetical protein